jgi:hypothetical protein
VMAHVTKEYRMPAPKNCPQFIYGLMLECWNEDPTERPAYFTIFERLLACWNICKPISMYAKSYTYDEAGNRVVTISPKELVMNNTDYEMEEGDMYDLGGETDQQIVGKRRVVKDPKADQSEVEQENGPSDYLVPNAPKPQDPLPPLYSVPSKSTAAADASTSPDLPPNYSQPLAQPSESVNDSDLTNAPTQPTPAPLAASAPNPEPPLPSRASMSGMKFLNLDPEPEINGFRDFEELDSMESKPTKDKDNGYLDLEDAV